MKKIKKIELYRKIQSSKNVLTSPRRYQALLYRSGFHCTVVLYTLTRKAVPRSDQMTCSEKSISICGTNSKCRTSRKCYFGCRYWLGNYELACRKAADSNWFPTMSC